MNRPIRYSPWTRRRVGLPSSTGTIEQDAATQLYWQVGVGVVGYQDDDTGDMAQGGYAFTVILVEEDTTFRAERVIRTKYAVDLQLTTQHQR